MLVLDASAVLELLLRTSRAPQIESRIFKKSESLSAPQLLDLEVLQVLRRYSKNEMTEDRCNLAIMDFQDMPITRYPHDLFVWRIWELRKSMTAYDAAYVALAEALNAQLLTCDSKLASAHWHAANIVLVA